MGHLITRCPAFKLLERCIWGCSLAPKGMIRRYEVLKWLEILSLQQSFLQRQKTHQPELLHKYERRQFS